MKIKNHILIIEDDPAIAKSLQAGLAKEGFLTTWRNLGEDGLNFACEQNPHLILLDIRLPDGSGFDFCARLRQLGISAPIIILTVKRDEADKILGLEIGADDFITKPFSFKELLSRIRAQLRRAYGEFSTAHASILRVGNLVIEQTSGKVSLGNQVVNLSPIGFRLLCYFARHPGQVLTRSQIIEEVWGHENDCGSERIVDVQINRLRERLGVDSENPILIETVPGIGYRLVK